MSLSLLAKQGELSSLVFYQKTFQDIIVRERRQSESTISHRGTLNVNVYKRYFKATFVSHKIHALYYSSRTDPVKTPCVLPLQRKQVECFRSNETDNICQRKCHSVLIGTVKRALIHSVYKVQ